MPAPLPPTPARLRQPLSTRTPHDFAGALQDHPEGVVIPGLRYARNLHTHQLVAATTLLGGLTVPFTVPFSIQVHIVWRRVEDLPDTGWNSKHKKAQRQSYADHLAGRSPALTLEHAAQWLRTWRDQSGV